MYKRVVSPEVVDEHVANLRESGKLLFVATTGAEGGLLEALWRLPRATENLLGFRFNYSRSETALYLGGVPDQYVSAQTAIAMAQKSLEHGRLLACMDGKAERDVIGVGMTAAVATQRHRRGDDRVYISVTDGEVTNTYFVGFQKASEHAEFEERRALRIRQGQLCDLTTLNALLSIAGLPLLLGIELNAV